MMTPEIFFNFLIDNGCVVSYFRNINTIGKMTFSKVIEVRSATYWISDAFVFNRTPEGYRYWNEIEAKWQLKINCI